MFKKSNKPNKYRNEKVTIGDITFASKKESQRYLFLKDAEAKGLISNLELQPKFELIPAIKETYIEHLKTKDKVKERTLQKPIHYIGDFSYIKDGERIIEDVKGSEYMLTKEFELKFKMMRYFHNIEIKLVYKPTEPI